MRLKCVALSMYQFNEGMCDMFTVRFTFSDFTSATRVGVTLDELPYVIDSMKRDVYGLKIVSLTLLPVGGFIQ